MTEHSPSLIERASEAFAFAAPPVVAPPPRRRAEPTRRAEPALIAPVAAPAAMEAPAALEASAAEAPRGVAPAAAAPFTGPRFPIDREHLRELGMIVPDGPITGLLEEFRIIKRQLLVTAAESRAGKGPPHGERILICSALPGEGKTYCAVNLALSIAAEKDNEVLLVDADFAKPSVLSTLGLPGGAGLMDALADPALAVEDCIIGTDVAGLYVLPAGNPSGSDTEYLASSRTAGVLDRLTADSPSRVVIFDSSPALAASPASELAMHVGQAVMVVRADCTGEGALRDALSLVSGCEDVKLLLNDTRFSPTGRRFGAYYGYEE